ncbi:MAG TPA: hypothetical protein DEG78_02095 [Rhodobacteraceae bacterium]|nr:hypothetical protein [Marinovum sp.]HBY11931.1 hypothetical protein [Paracoccaceae bacterium]
MPALPSRQNNLSPKSIAALAQRRFLHRLNHRAPLTGKARRELPRKVQLHRPAFEGEATGNAQAMPPAEAL